MIKTQQNPLSIMRHSCAHVLATAILQLYPRTKLGIGPAIENGFYYDFEFEKPLTEDDFPKIEAEMAKVIKKNYPFIKKSASIAEAKKIFKNQPYKLELIKELESRGEKKISLYQSGDFWDLCAGPHLESTGKIGPFKLLSLAGAYWKGNEKNPMLTRIYGTCFPSQKGLSQYLNQIEEAQKRDHRLLGKKLDLFSFHPEAAPGDVFWHPKGYFLMRKLIEFWREEHEKAGYVEVRTPEILKNEIWQQSGHLKSYAEKMYRITTPDSKKWNYCVKPMNCNGGMIIYKSKQRSYRDLPLRMGELGIVHRYEASGELHGIIRPREFTQDDAHIYCTPEQIKTEIKKIIDLCFYFYQTFNLKLDHLELSTRPKKSIGSTKNWQKAERIMKELLDESNVKYQINKGEGAFYGPKIDFHLKDSIGRTWQCSTIQLDFAQPENFDLTYTTAKGTKERPVMIHRVIYGSLERFLGILIENCLGAFPAWLSPTQAVIIPITDKQIIYAQQVGKKLAKTNIRFEIDNQNQTASFKIRHAETQKIPYILVVGDKEIKNKTINVRQRGEKILGEMKVGEWTKKVKEEIKEKNR